MYQLNISPLVYEDLQEVKDYITEELCNPQAAADLMKLITGKIRELPDFPNCGSPLNAIIDIQTDYRFLVCNNYMVFYRVEMNMIFVTRVLYQGRDYMKILFAKTSEYNN